VFCQIKLDHKEFEEFELYKLLRKKILKTKDEALHFLDLLIAKELVNINIYLQHPIANSANLTYSLQILGSVEGSTAMTNSLKWEIT
ncbi:7094_t:CDS:1, partial [Racocetra fulgida]